MNDIPSALPAFKGIIDSTLREGLQFSRANFSLDEQRRIFSHLARIGVDAVEVGNPAQPAVRETIGALVRRRGSRGPLIFAHVRNHPDDVVRAIGCGVDGVSILCTVDAERLAAMGKTLPAYIERLAGVVAEAKASGLRTRVGVEDFFGQSREAAIEIYAAAAACGVDRLAAADTLGRSLGWDVARGIRELRRRFPTDIEVHFHNDLGHAVGNALAAIRAGANWISTSLLGIGERTGITPLSSFLANLHVLDPAAAGRYGLRRLTAAEGYVARLCGIEVPPHLMTNPANGFAHKAGIHLDALIKFGPGKYECFPPQILGNARRLVIGTAVSGKTTRTDVLAFERRFGGAAR